MHNHSSLPHKNETIMKIKSYLLAGLATFALASCDESFNDWAEQAGNTQPDAVAFGNGAVAPVDLIDFANVPEGIDSVQVCQITSSPTSNNSSYGQKYTITYTYEYQEAGETKTTTTTLNMGATGKVAFDEFKSYVETTYGKRPTERDLPAQAKVTFSNGSTASYLTSDNFTVKVKPAAPFIDNGYYLVGDMFNVGEGDDAISGWSAEGMKAFSHSGSDVYDNPIFTITFTTTKDDQYWKIIPKTNADAGDIWTAGVVGTIENGDASMSGTLVNNDAQAGRIAKAGKYKMTLNMMDYTYTIEAVNYDPAIYFIGATDGWNNNEKNRQKLALTDDSNGTYTGYIYCADPNGWGNEFKFQRTVGSWDNEINAGTFNGFEGAAINKGGNIGVAEEGVYYFEVSLGNGTIKATKVETMGLVGDFTGWADGADVIMTWNAKEYCYEATNAGVTAAGWKFRVNGAWDINLGGSIDDLSNGGSNLSVVGNTIKLYPTRKTSESIYCTVE